MKYILTLFLFCLIFQNAMADKLSRRKKLAKFALTSRSMIKEKEKRLRKLDDKDAELTSEISEATTPPAENYTVTPDDKPESASATAQNSPVNPEKPVSTKPKNTDNKSASVQFSKIHGFKPPPPGPGLVIFETFFYLLGIPIPKFVIMRTRIGYNDKINSRSLQEKVAESARTDCEIEDPSLAGLVDKEGQNINYKCELNATMGDASTANYTINTDVPLTLISDKGEIDTMSFEDVNFNGDTADAASNLQNNVKQLKGILTIKNAMAYFDKYILKITGERQSTNRLRGLINDGDPITMNIKNNKDETKTYDCTIQGTKKAEAELSCDTSGDKLKTTVEKMHLSSGNCSDGTLITVEMLGHKQNGTSIIEPYDERGAFYKKSSSGLSGGAIAGIVITCVAVLIAASIAAILLRKPAPPMDNTSIANLKSENI